MKRSIVVTVVVALLGAGMVAGVAMATPGAGVTATELARATTTERIKIRVKHESDVVMQHITFSPGGHTGWHSHPGPAVVLVTSGALTLYSGDDPTCTGVTYTAGQSFVDPGEGDVHIARNEGEETVGVFVTYFAVPIGGSVRVDVPDPGNCDGS